MQNYLSNYSRSIQIGLHPSQAPHQHPKLPHSFSKRHPPPRLLRSHAAVGDLEAVLRTWEEYTSVEKRVCAESYNVVMRVYAELGKDCEAVRVFYRMVEEGALPNCRTYTVMIEHMVKCGKLEAAMEVFKVLPFMRVKRSLRQYEVLVEACVGAKQFEGVKALLVEMRVDGILPGRAMRLSLERMREAGFVEESDDFLKEMLPNEGIKSIGYCDDCRDDDDDDDNDDDDDGIQM
ncbi:hypothetical protein ACLB2K_008266 [Fragaria x ananassa]